jgi:hypothetical protein
MAQGRTVALPEARDYFVSLTGLFKNLNYSQEETPEYRQLLKKIQELADSTANPKQA